MTLGGIEINTAIENFKSYRLFFNIPKHNILSSRPKKGDMFFSTKFGIFNELIDLEDTVLWS